MSRTIYADTDAGKIGAVLDPQSGMVHVWQSNGPALGLYKIERFQGEKLTAATLRALFTLPTSGVTS